jgi:hypothetical protein
MKENLLMPVVPSGIVNQRQLATAIQKAANALAPDVVRIRYALTIDSTGSAAIFFRVLLSDRASRPDRLYETTEGITAKILEIVQPQERFGMDAYFNFRSESEQSKLQDAAWE